VRVLIAAGGTGGHLFPALAIARSLRRRDPEMQIHFAVSGIGREEEWLEGEGIPAHRIAVKGLKGKRADQLVLSLASLPRALMQCWHLLSLLAPQVVVGLGGYVSGPLLLLSTAKGIPTLIHEQNAFPGLANRIAAPFVRHIAYSFPGSERHFRVKRVKMTCTGMPIRREITQGSRGEAALRFGLDPERFTVLCFGGSQGARKINLSLLESLSHLMPLQRELQFLHVSGQIEFETVASGYSSFPFPARIFPFVRDMASAYALADLVVCRAGASTIAELAACGKPSILIPYPHAANDHQRRNAEALAGIGGAFLLPDEELNGSRLAGLIEQCYRDPEGRRIMGMKAGSFARVDADQRVAELVLSLIREGERSKEELPC